MKIKRATNCTIVPHKYTLFHHLLINPLKSIDDLGYCFVNYGLKFSQHVFVMLLTSNVHVRNLCYFSNSVKQTPARE